jgi:hypothetical protein
MFQRQQSSLTKKKNILQNLLTKGLISSWLATVALIVVMVASQERKMTQIGN